MSPPQETDKEHTYGTRQPVEGLHCPYCGARRLQFGGDRESPWRCIECGAAFRVPDGLLGREGELYPVEAFGEGTPPTGRPTQRPRTHTGDQGSAYLSENDVSLLQPNALLTVLIWLARLAMLLAGLFAIILGGHGLYVYLNAVEGVLPTGRDSAHLFLVVDVPSQFDRIVNWCSVEALGSWAIPVSLIFGGGLALWIQENWSRSSRFWLS